MYGLLTLIVLVMLLVTWLVIVGCVWAVYCDCIGYGVGYLVGGCWLIVG